MMTFIRVTIRETESDFELRIVSGDVLLLQGLQGLVYGKGKSRQVPVDIATWLYTRYTQDWSITVEHLAGHTSYLSCIKDKKTKLSLDQQPMRVSRYQREPVI